MTGLRKTIIFIPPGHTSAIEVRIYVSEKLQDVAVQGYWFTEINNVVLSPFMYSLFSDLRGDQIRQRKFFDQLIKCTGKTIDQ